MCPNKKTLSAFYDQELTSKKQAKVFSHLQGCLLCQKQIAAIKSLSAKMEEVSYRLCVTSKEAIWHQIQLHNVSSRKDLYSYSQRKATKVLAFTAIPLSVAAAVFIAALVAYVLVGRVDSQVPMNSSESNVASTYTAPADTSSPQESSSENTSTTPSLQEQIKGQEFYPVSSGNSNNRSKKR